MGDLIIKIRIGKDFTVVWSIYRRTADKREAYDLTGLNLTLHLQNAYRTEEIKDFSVEGNTITWVFRGRDQKSIGLYSLVLIQNNGEDGMMTIDKVNAFMLVAHTKDETGNNEGAVKIQTVRLESESGIMGGAIDTELNRDSKNAIANSTVTRALKSLDEEKQDSIADLETIREGAKKGATAIQNVKTINSQSIVGVGNINIEGADVTYKSSIDNKKLEMPSAVGGLEKGTTIESLEGNTFSRIFDDILFPTVIPTFTVPTASLQFKNYASIKEVGSTAPTASDFTTGYNAGVIAINGVKQANNGGALDSANSFIYLNSDAENKILPETVALGNTTFVYRASFAEGPQPKDNKGNNFGAPLAAGYVDSPAITLNGTYPWFASTASASEDTPVVKQRLVAWKATAGAMNTGEFELQPSGTLPQVFKLPRKISTLQMLNTVSNKMETIELGDYNETTETINIGGVDVTYYVYTYKGAARGSVTLLASF